MISIVIATFNSEKTLERCLQSVISQKKSVFEILIKDGASTDRTCEIIAKYAGQIKYWDSSPDAGVYDAWNHCLTRISGDWFIFLGSDDYFLYDCFLSDISEQLQSVDFETATIAHGRNMIVDASGVELGLLGSPWDEAKKKIGTAMTIRHPGCFHSSRLLKAVGLFDTRLRIAGDHHYILRALQYGAPISYDQIGVAHEVGGLSTNPKNYWLLIKETYFIRKDIGLTPAFFPDVLMIKRLILLSMHKLIGEKALKAIMSAVKNRSN